MLRAGERHRGDEGGGGDMPRPGREGTTGMGGEGGSARWRLNQGKGMGKIGARRGAC
jgi:hypothetical protein